APAGPGGGRAPGGGEGAPGPRAPLPRLRSSRGMHPGAGAGGGGGPGAGPASGGRRRPMMSPAPMMTYWLGPAFPPCRALGSFINVCVSRLPYEKSLLWPGSRCGSCFQPIKLLDNIPLVSYWVLRGRCRTCGARFSIRYFLVELFTALAFAGLFYLDVY